MTYIIGYIALGVTWHYLR